MAVAIKKIIKALAKPHRTSIGQSAHSRPKNKATRRSHKPYRGQGKRQ
jgi:hypothetical protein